MESGAVQRSEETGGDGGGDDDEGAQRRRYRPRDASVAPREWSTYFPRVAYDRDDRRCELASALIDAMCRAVRFEAEQRLFDEVRRSQRTTREDDAVSLLFAPPRSSSSRFEREGL